MLDHCVDISIRNIHRQQTSIRLAKNNQGTQTKGAAEASTEQNNQITDEGERLVYIYVTMVD